MHDRCCKMCVNVVYIVHFDFTMRKKTNFLFPFGADDKLNYSSRLFTSCFHSVITVAAALPPLVNLKSEPYLTNSGELFLSQTKSEHALNGKS